MMRLMGYGMGNERATFEWGTGQPHEEYGG